MCSFSKIPLRQWLIHLPSSYNVASLVKLVKTSAKTGLILCWAMHVDMNGLLNTWSWSPSLTEVPTSGACLSFDMYIIQKLPPVHLLLLRICVFFTWIYISASHAYLVLEWDIRSLETTITGICELLYSIAGSSVRAVTTLKHLAISPALRLWLVY